MTLKYKHEIEVLSGGSKRRPTVLVATPVIRILNMHTRSATSARRLLNKDALCVTKV